MDEPKLTAKAAKAYAGRVITEWLAHALVTAHAGLLRNNEQIRLATVTVMLTRRVYQF